MRRCCLMIALSTACIPTQPGTAAPPPPALEPAFEPADPAIADAAFARETRGGGEWPGSAGPEGPGTVPSIDAQRAKPGSAKRAPTKPPPAAAPSSDAAQMVDAHNRVRAKHCAAPLAWSAKLAQVAQQWANALRDKGCAFGHSGGSYGENLAAGTSGTLDPEAVVRMWYDEVALYKFPNGGFSSQTGHFTQVVWRGTSHVGCARSQCKGMDIFVCEYDPAGNWEGQYRDNVKPTGCK